MENGGGASGEDKLSVLVLMNLLLLKKKEKGKYILLHELWMKRNIIHE